MLKILTTLLLYAVACNGVDAKLTKPLARVPSLTDGITMPGPISKESTLKETNKHAILPKVSDSRHLKFVQALWTIALGLAKKKKNTVAAAVRTAAVDQQQQEHPRHLGLPPRCRDIPDEYCCRTVWWDTECFNSCSVKDLKFHVIPGANCEFNAATEDALAQAQALGCPDPNSSFPCDETAVQDVVEDNWQDAGPDYACELFCSSFGKDPTPTPTPVTQPPPPTNPPTVGPSVDMPTDPSNSCGEFRFQCFLGPGLTDEEEEREAACIECITTATGDARESAGSAPNCLEASNLFCAVPNSCASICQDTCTDEVDAWVEFDWCDFNNSAEGSSLGCEDLTCGQGLPTDPPMATPTDPPPMDPPTDPPVDLPTTGPPTDMPTDPPPTDPPTDPASTPQETPAPTDGTMTEPAEMMTSSSTRSDNSLFMVIGFTGLSLLSLL